MKSMRLNVPTYKMFVVARENQRLGVSKLSTVRLGRDLLGSALLTALILVLIACGSTSKPASTVATVTPAGPVNPDASGNWQIALTPTEGAALFPAISGYIKDDVSDTTSTKFATAEWSAVASTGCFAGPNAIFANGSIDGTQVTLGSLSVNGQFFNISGILDSTSSTMSGTYQVQGACANGAQGTIAGTRYAPLTGTYGGSVDATNAAQTLQLVLAQNSQGNGNGNFLVTGTAAITGISCFSTATLLTPYGYVTGSSLQLSFATTDPAGAQLVLTGSFDVAADMMTLSSISVTSGACAGSYGTATLKLQS